MTFDVDVLEGDLAGADGPASVFIDIIGRPFTPLSFAGVARRTAWRGAFYLGAAFAGSAAVAGAVHEREGGHPGQTRRGPRTHRHPPAPARPDARARKFDDRRFMLILTEDGMSREDFEILFELCESITQLEQRTGVGPGRRVTSSSIKRRVTEFARECEQGDLKGRSRKRKANNLLLEILRALEKA